MFFSWFADAEVRMTFDEDTGGNASEWNEDEDQAAVAAAAKNEYIVQHCLMHPCLAR